MAAPAAPTVTPTGGATTNYTYYVVAVNAHGDSLPGATTSITTGPTTLDATHFNTVGWAAVPGASSYKIIRSVGGPSQGLITTVTANNPNTGTYSYQDQGAAGSVYTQATSAPGGQETAVSYAATGLLGATAATRYVGGTTSGAPASGTFSKGDFVIDQGGKLWVCSVAGSPGTWVSTTTISSATPAALASAGAAGSSTAASAGDHVHPWTGLAVLSLSNTFTSDQNVQGSVNVYNGITNNNPTASDLLLTGGTAKNVKVASGQRLYQYTGPSTDQGPYETPVGWGSQCRTLFTANTRNDTFAQEGDILFNV